MNIPFLDLKKQYDDIKHEIDAVIAAVIAESAFVGGPHVRRFEESFARFVGVKHCIGVANGTDAIFIALKAFGIGGGDEVITVANSFIATSEAITLAGARVVFVDIDPDTCNIDVRQIEARITPRTRAIVPVHLYGRPADMDPILTLARQYKLVVIEDAAQAHGGEYKGRRVGSMADAASFSFYPGKNLGAYGDGGALVTNDDVVAARARQFSNHGQTEKYNHAVEGVNSRLDGIQAAVLDVKLKHLPEWTERRRRNARQYSELLAPSDVVTPRESSDVSSVYHLYVIRVRAEIREALRGYLQEQKVSTGLHYPIALPNLPAYAHLGHTPRDFPEATKGCREILSLPMYPELTEDEISYVCEKVTRFISSHPALELHSIPT